MIAVYINARSGMTRFEFDESEVRVGSSEACALRLPNTRPHHATLLPRAAGCFIVDAGANDTKVNHRLIDAPRALYRDDIVDLGDGQRLFVEHLDGERNPIERRLLIDIRRGDLAAREVYADWLDENGDPRRAELLRVEDACAAIPRTGGWTAQYPGDPDREAIVRRRRELGIVIDLDWRIQITRVPVERCNHLDCTRNWDDLEETRDPTMRRCDECAVEVRYCESRDGMRIGGRVVVDATVRRDFEDEDTFDASR